MYYDTYVNSYELLSPCMNCRLLLIRQKTEQRDSRVTVKVYLHYSTKVLYTKIDKIVRIYIHKSKDK